jgi:hypothetical protein
MAIGAVSIKLDLRGYSHKEFSMNLMDDAVLNEFRQK